MDGRKKKLTAFEFKLAKICHFYGMGLREVYELDLDELDLLWKAITRIEAQRLLVEFNIADWPHMKKEVRGQMHRKIFRQAYPEQVETETIKSAEELAGFLALG